MDKDGAFDFSVSKGGGCVHDTLPSFPKGGKGSACLVVDRGMQSKYCERILNQEDTDVDRVAETQADCAIPSP